MKRTLFLLLMVLLMAATACNRSTCPTFDDNAGEKSMQGSKGKAKSGIIPPGRK